MRTHCLLLVTLCFLFCQMAPATGSPPRDSVRLRGWAEQHFRTQPALRAPTEGDGGWNWTRQESLVDYDAAAGQHCLWLPRLRDTVSSGQYGVEEHCALGPGDCVSCAGLTSLGHRPDHYHCVKNGGFCLYSACPMYSRIVGTCYNGKAKCCT